MSERKIALITGGSRGIGLACAKELAKALGISLHLAYDLMHWKGFPSMRIGKRLLVNAELLKVWLNKNSNFGEID